MLSDSVGGIKTTKFKRSFRCVKHQGGAVEQAGLSCPTACVGVKPTKLKRRRWYHCVKRHAVPPNRRVVISDSVRRVSVG